MLNDIILYMEFSCFLSLDLICSFLVIMLLNWFVNVVKKISNKFKFNLFFMINKIVKFFKFKLIIVKEFVVWDFSFLIV